MAGSIADLRRDYRGTSLDEATAGADPLALFASWFDEARAGGLYEPNAVALATADRQGRPSLRMVLLKDFDETGFVFYTNVESRKAHEIAARPEVALLFWWDRLHRQVRIEGRASAVSAGEADAYFASRPRGSQLSAAVSPQSRVIASREELEAEVEMLAAAHPGAVPRPAHWSGLRVAPAVMEFWQGRESRLHDRLRYVRAGAAWRRERLAP